MNSWRKLHPLTGEAARRAGVRALARYHRSTGRLRAKPCERCGSRRRIEMHHPDYRRPLDVRWFCRKHHVALHRAAR